MQVGALRAAALQAHDIESDQIGDLPERIAEGNDVAGCAGQSGHHGALADAHELVHRGLTAEESVIADADMAAEHDVVGEGDGIADVAIVPDMTSRHEEAALADWVTPPPSSVPVFMVTLSRSSQRGPITSRVAPPR